MGIDINLLKKRLNPDDYPRTYNSMKYLGIYEERSLLLEIYTPISVNYQEIPKNTVEFDIRSKLIKILHKIQNTKMHKLVFESELMEFHSNYRIRLLDSHTQL